MTRRSTIETRKKLSVSEMNWMISQGYAWEYSRNDGGSEDRFETQKRAYRWVTPAAGQLEGHYEALG